MQDVSLDHLRVFTHVARQRSFTGAARTLGISKVAVSQQIRKLEADLGTQLLIRTTRAISLTEPGQELLAGASLTLKHAAETLLRVKHRANAGGGRLRITAPQDLAPLIAPAAAQLMWGNSDLELEIVANDGVVNLVEEGFDLAIRVGWLRDSRLHAVLLKGVAPLLLAAPAYLAAKGPPTTPEDLGQHRWVSQSNLPARPGWRFTGNGRSARISPRASSLTNSTLVTKALLVSGAGVGILPEHVVAEELKAGALVRVLPGWKLPAAGIFAVHPYDPRYSPAKVRGFIAAVRAALGR